MIIEELLKGNEKANNPIGQSICFCKGVKLRVAFTVSLLLLSFGVKGIKFNVVLH